MKKNVHCILINDEGFVLCVSRKDDYTDFGLPGGKVEAEDLTELDALHREVKEETGLDIYNTKLIFACHRNGSMGYTYIADFSGTINTTEPHVVKWGTFADLIDGSFGEWNYMVYQSLLDMDLCQKIN